MGRKKRCGMRVFLTDHYAKRYRQRVGTAPESSQRSWILNSLRVNRPRRGKDGKLRLKLRGSSCRVVLANEWDIWIAVTVVNEGG